MMANKKGSVFVVLLVAVFTGLALGQGPVADSPAKVVGSPAFKLSDAAAAAGIDGKLSVGLTVDKSGAAKNVTILGGPSWPCGTDPKDEIDKVRDAVKQNILVSKFSPAVKDGKPYSTDVTMTFTIGRAYLEEQEQKKFEDGIKNGTVKPIQGGVLNGKALSLPKPEYPTAARMSRASGAVAVELLADEQGNVVEAGAMTGHQLLRAAAREAACRVKFAPLLFQGKPVKLRGRIVYTFIP
jgi:TonB family protein